MITTLLGSPKERKFKKMIKAGLPSAMIPPLAFLVDESEIDPQVSEIASRVEAVREGIRAGGQKTIEVIYSPKPGSSGATVTPDLRPNPGARKQFTMEQIAKTGKNRRWGTFLHLCARAAKAKTILELGSCAGISGCYLATAPTCREFCTVEGAQALSTLAEQSLKQMVSNARVLNMLFDDALDMLLPKMAEIDLAFIDGHHEKVATLHYFDRIKPRLADGAYVIFDDISWSQDMRDGWNVVLQMPCFSHAFDCGGVGVCIFRREVGAKPILWNMQEVLGAHPIGDPHGWKD